MRLLLVSRDPRFAHPLQRRGPPDTSWLPVPDTAAAIRALADADRGRRDEDGAAAPGARGGRSADGVAAALAADTRGTVDVARRELVGPRGRVHLTPSESALVVHLIRARGPVSAARLLRQALGYQDDASRGVIRTHLASLRRRGRRAGLFEIVQTLPHRGYRARGLTLQG